MQDPKTVKIGIFKKVGDGLEFARTEANFVSPSQGRRAQILATPLIQ